MDENDADRDSIAGLSVDVAAARVAGREDTLDEETARRVLQTVSQDGIVSRAGVETALADVSKVISTPETRLELAANAFEDVRETADPVADLDAVGARLRGFEARLSAIETGVEDLSEELQTLIGASEDADIYALAERLRRLTARANSLQREADELQVDLEDFERWLNDPDRRREELKEEVNAVGTYLDQLEDDIDRLEEPNDTESPGSLWTDASLRCRVAALLIADVRAEVDDLRTWADREDNDGARVGSVSRRIADLNDRLTALDGQLQEVTRPGWRDRFGARIEAFEQATAEFEPPIPWDEVETLLEKHRPDG